MDQSNTEGDADLRLRINLPPGNIEPGTTDSQTRLNYGHQFPAAHQLNGTHTPVNNEPLNNENERSDNSRPNRASIAFIVITAFYLCLCIFIHQRMNTYPLPKSAQGSKIDEFVEENARVHLKKLTDMGPKVSGSGANLQAETYILNSIETIAKQKNANFELDVDVQVASGIFTLDLFKVGFTSVYQNLRNIVVKVSPVEQTNNSVLLNCHYDTVADSPG